MPWSGVQIPQPPLLCGKDRHTMENLRRKLNFEKVAEKQMLRDEENRRCGERVKKLLARYGVDAFDHDGSLMVHPPDTAELEKLLRKLTHL